MKRETCSKPDSRDGCNKKMESERINRTELSRKAVHLLGVLIPILYLRFEEEFLCLFLPLAALFFTLELLRLKIAAVGKWYLLLFGRMLRPDEHDQPSGGFYFVLGAVATILLFPRDIAISALLVLAVSDSAAAFIGQRYGRRQIFGKTPAGSSAFFFSAWFVLAVYFGDNPLKHLPAALLGTLVEALPWPLNDNLTIPIMVGLACWLML